MDVLDPAWKNDAEFCHKLQDNLKRIILNQEPEAKEVVACAIPKTKKDITPTKKDLYFPRLISSKWNNDAVGIHRFVKLPNECNNNNTFVREPITAMPQLKVRMAAGIDPLDYPCNADIKHRAFGFCFKGPAITQNDLEKTPNIKEAYGVELDNIHYVCIVCFNKASRRFHALSTYPYAIGLLPCSTIPEFVPGSDHHISVYKQFISTDDPILEMLKRPSANKWKWHSSFMQPE